MIRRRSSTVVAALVCGLLACGPNASPSEQGEPNTLVINPGDVRLMITGSQPATQTYEALWFDEDGKSHDVTDKTEFALGSSTLGDFDGSVLTTTSDRTGRTTVTGSYEGHEGEATLTVAMQYTVIEPGAPSDAPDRFDGASPGGTEPSLVYPQPGIMVPPNMSTLEVHYLPGAGNDLFDLELVGDLFTVDIYFVCAPLAEGCVYEPSQETWDLLATAGRGGGRVYYTLSGLQMGAAKPTVGVSQTSHLQFSRDDLLGGIYYWNAGGTGSIMRYEFGRRGQTAEPFLTVAQTGGTQCIGCHVLDRQGARIAVGLDIPAPASLETYQVADRTMLWRDAGGLIGGGGANFSAFSDDGTQILTSNGSNIRLRNAEDGATPTTVISKGTMPDWSPNGNRVVFARSTMSTPFPIGGNPGVGAASIIATTPGDWANEQVLVPSQSDNNYYPAISPDSEWVMFNKSHLQDSFDAKDAEVWVVSIAGGAPIKLAQASPTGGDSWPKWAPFIHAYSDGEILWLTFSSRRDYGLRLKNSTLGEEARAQIWMAAFDPARAATGQDGSFTAFWLPFQDLTSGNHIAQWVEEVDRQECDGGECPSGEFCEGGKCYPQIE